MSQLEKTFSPNLIEKINEKLSKLEVVKYTKEEAILKLLPKIKLSLKKGHSLKSIADIIKSSGISCSETILKKYISSSEFDSFNTNQNTDEAV